MSASRPGRSLPPGKTPYPLYRRLGGTQGWPGQVWKISPPPGFNPRTVQRVASRYTDWATQPTCNMRGAQIFPKSRSHIKILGIKWMTWGKFHTEDLHILGGAMQNLVDLMTGLSAPLCCTCIQFDQGYSLLNVSDVRWPGGHFLEVGPTHCRMPYIVQYLFCFMMS